MTPHRRTETRPPEETISVSDATRYLSLSTRTIHRLVEQLPAIRVAGRWRFRLRDLDDWILGRRSDPTLLPEPVASANDSCLYPYIAGDDIYMDAPQRTSRDLIRAAIYRARLPLAGGSDEEARERILQGVLEREMLSSTALHPDVAFPHPRDPEKCALAEHRIIVVRAIEPVDFGDAHGHRPRLVLILLARTAAVQLVWEARLSYLLHRHALAERLLGARSAREIHDVFAVSSEATPAFPNR